MNCFQIVSLRYWWHHSFQFPEQKKVVNCFQIVSLRYWWHHYLFFPNKPWCCELLSDCIFEVLVTPFYVRQIWICMLWIAFRLYLWGIGDTTKTWSWKNLPVVNCFQIVSLRYWWHRQYPKNQPSSRCELLSDCIFEVLVTPRAGVRTISLPLWIAFRLYLWGIGDTAGQAIGLLAPVVNCFQIVSLRYWWHHILTELQVASSCELLSDCIFEVLVTPVIPCYCYFVVLWIAFRLYLWGIGDTRAW